MDSQEVQIAEPMASLIPGRLNLRFRVPKALTRQSDMPTPYVTTYAACELPNKIRVDEFGDHVFIADQDGPAGYHEFLFVEDRGDAIFEPVELLSIPKAEPHLWKDCLIQLGAISDATQPLNMQVNNTVVEVPRLFGRMHKLPGGVYATEIDVEVFVSHRPFTREEMGLLEAQVTTQIVWQGRNLSVNEDCLHDHVEFAETQTSGRVLSQWGTVNNPLTGAGKTVFPATSMKKWRRYLFDQKHELVAGQWRLTNYYANPPKSAKAILNMAV
jgi:hypothetical protein